MTIPARIVPIADRRTGLVTKAWYDHLKDCVLTDTPADPPTDAPGAQGPQGEPGPKGATQAILDRRDQQDRKARQGQPDPKGRRVLRDQPDPQTGGSSLADNVATGVSSGVPAINVQNQVMGHGILVCGASAGTAQFKFRPEVAASATCKAGSVIRVMKIS